MAKHWPAIATAFLIGATTACSPGGPAVSTPTTSVSPSLSPEDEARQVMDYFGLELPADAQQVRVYKPPLGEFRAKAVVSFIAPRDEVMTQTCRNIKSKEFDTRPVLLGGIDRDLLDYANADIDLDQYRSCYQYIGGRRIRILFPLTEVDTTYVVIYHMPYR